MLLQPIPGDLHQDGPIRRAEEIAVRLHPMTGIDPGDSVKRFSEVRGFPLYQRKPNNKLRVIILHAYVRLVILGVRVVLDLYVEAANAFYWDLAIPQDRVIVEVDGGLVGLVTLHGEVERAYQRSCAEEDVRRAPGVISVMNEITVGPAQEFN